MNIAIILAGGKGVRTGLSYPKQFYRVKNKPVLVYTLEKFQKANLVDRIVVVCAKEWKNEVWSYKKNFEIHKLSKVVEAGETGILSAFNGLMSLEKVNSDDLIIFHDGVRPFVDVNVIEENIKIASEYGLAMAAVDCVETLVYSENGCWASKMIARDGIKRIQTPQTFSYGIISRFMKKIDLQKSNQPSIFSLWMSEGNKIYCSKGNEKNVKLTYQEDIEYFVQMFTKCL